jgi:hypothetical protein
MMFQNKDIELPLYLFFKKLQAYDAQRHHHALSGDVYLQLVPPICMASANEFG